MSAGSDPRDPHRGAPVLASGTPITEARGAVVLVHGRGGSAEEMLALARELDRPGFAYLAPQASGYSWYPYSFLEPLEQNEPHLSSALGLLSSVVARAIESGVGAEHLVLLGFSQGACLTVEFGARNARGYGAVVALTGGLIGPDSTPRDYPGTFAGTPVFLGSSDPDPHVPVSRVEATRRVLERMDAKVTMKLYPGMGHTINTDELDHARALMDSVLDDA